MQAQRAIYSSSISKNDGQVVKITFWEVDNVK